MSKLIAVRRMDKNGVMSTKWVTPPSGATAASSSIPAPKLSSSSSTLKIFAPKYREEVDVADTEVGSLYRKSMLKHSRSLESFDVQTLQAVEHMVYQAIASGLSYQADSEVGTAFNIVHSQIQKGAQSGEYTAFNNLAVFGDVVVQPDSVNCEVQSLVEGIAEYFPKKDFLLEATDSEREKAVALVTAAARLKEPLVTINGGFYDDHRTISIRSDIFAYFIMSRPDDAAEIARIANERGTEDVGTIREVLDHGNKALSEGVL